MRYSRLLFMLVAVLPNPALADTLRGFVKDTDGNPIVGARVDISTAAPKSGPAIFCPSCYCDCAKFARTDQHGRFELTSLDPTLKFRLLVTASGWQTASTDLLDPAAESTSITLVSFPADVPPNRILQGTVVSAEGVPIPGALVDPVGARTASRRFSGRATGARAAVADDKGEFCMLLTDDYLAVDVEVTAHRFPGTIERQLSPGEQRHRIKVPSGASVTGRLVFRGQPQVGTIVTVSQVNRGRHDRVFIKSVMATTGRDGTYRFTALPADEPYVIYTAVGLGPTGPVLTTRLFDAGKDGESRGLGTLDTDLGFTLAGQIQMTDKTDVPEDIRLILHRYPAWDFIQVPVEADGAFRIENLPPETYEIALSPENVLLDAEQLGFQMLGTRSFGVHLVESQHDLVIPIRRWKEGDPPVRRRSGRPVKVSGNQTLAGKVVDRNGTPVPGITIDAYLVRGGKPSGATVKSDNGGKFTLRDLPDEDIELTFADRSAYGYPLGITSSGKPMKMIMYPGFLRPHRNQTNIRLLFDPRLRTPPLEQTKETEVISRNDSSGASQE